MKRKTIIVTITIIALLATGAIAATVMPREDETASDTSAQAKSIEGNIVSEKAPVAAALPANIKTEIAATAELTEYVSVNGTAEAMTDVTFSAEIPGRIEYLGPKLGQRVRKGQVLARIDFRTLQAQKMQAQAAYELARTTHDRLSKLGEDLVTRQKIDETVSALATAKAGLDIAKNAMDKSVVRSNIRGVVTEKQVDTAEYVAPGMPMYRIVDHSTIVIEAELPETQVSLIQNNAAVTVTFGALGETRDGTVDAILPMADPVSKTFTARIKVDNSDLSILVGMSATVRIAAQINKDVVVVPQDVVVENKTGRSVFVVENGIAIERPVRLGAVEGDRVAIVDGVMPGESLVTLGHRDLSDGQPVRIVQ
ncbi:MAG: efflux RND transporter periplasmic adaptor subunit [Myxococcota bacterium]|nr:efflux RND transporter periplasmic adaptor subunit [Myxococcota bacterium]